MCHSAYLDKYNFFAIYVLYLPWLSNNHIPHFAVKNIRLNLIRRVYRIASRPAIFEVSRIRAQGQCNT